MTGTRILLAEDQAQVLQFLRLFPEHRYDVVGAVQDERMLLTAVTVLKPDIVVVDVDLLKLNGMHVIRQLRKLAPTCCVVLTSAHAEPERMAEAYAAGVSAYLVREPFLSWMLAIRTIIDRPQWAGQWKSVPPAKNLDLTQRWVWHDLSAGERGHHSKDGTNYDRSFRASQDRRSDKQL